MLVTVMMNLIYPAAWAVSIDQMKKSTVLLFLVDNDGEPVALGSGFVVGNGKYVVTCNHCIADVAKGYHAIVVLSPKDIMKADHIYPNPQKDLAVLQFDQPLGRPDVSFVTSDMVKDGDAVWAVGFPGAAERLPGQTEQNMVDPKVTNGIISGKQEGQGKKLYLMNVLINSGNSGGPLFNDSGQVIGINEMGAPDSPGINWSIQVDDLLPMLDQIGIKYQKGITDKSSGSSPGNSEAGKTQQYLFYFMTGLAIVLIVVAIATKQGREVAKQAYNKIINLMNRRNPVVPRYRATLSGTAGYYNGKTLPLDEKPIVIGRDPGQCQLVIPDKDISKKHCTLHFDAASQRCILSDCSSTNGTYIQSGQQVQPGQPCSLNSGDGFYLCDRNNMFVVQLELIK